MLINDAQIFVSDGKWHLHIGEDDCRGDFENVYQAMIIASMLQNVPFNSFMELAVTSFVEIGKWERENNHEIPGGNKAPNEVITDAAIEEAVNSIMAAEAKRQTCH